MSIAATFNSNYAGLSLGISNKPAPPLGERASIIAEIVGRILQSTSNSASSAPPANASAAIILEQLLASTKLFDSTNGAAPMELNLNQLLNSSVLQKALAQLPPELLAKPQVIEALVLQNT
ncbi:MAG TPA: hypothetical protein VFM32_09115, partial [Spongiibacteraceae bacterium]|nr:hypothetical protein [Spongiibacteraceae bacterium]